MMELSDGPKSFKIGLAVIGTIPACDGQTDVATAIAALCYAPRDQKKTQDQVQDQKFETNTKNDDTKVSTCIRHNANNVCIV